jgi:hypothetical protein
MSAQSEFDAAVDDQRASMDVALDVDALEPVQDFWAEESDRLVGDLMKQTGGRSNLPVDAALVAFLASYLGMHLIDFTAKFAKKLKLSATSTMEESLRSLNDFIKRVTGGKKTLLDDDTRIHKIVELRRLQLETMRNQTAAQFGVQMHNRLKERLLAVPTEMQEKRSVADLISTIGTGINEEWWRVERIVVTETAFAYNEAQWDGMTNLSKNDPNLRALMMRWTERITDGGMPMDKKVAQDSIAMHAQLAPPGGSFIMPPDAGAKVGNSLRGRFWSFPPNRPHDRAVLTPWFPGSGQPGWVWNDGYRDGRQYLS